VDEFYSHHVSALGRGCRILDLGGHKDSKRGCFDLSNYDAQVIYTNITEAKGADVIGRAESVPFADDSFDAVICAELLEHVRDPAAALHEIHRVLHTGGIVLATVPFLYRFHGDPNDFGRYTEDYWNTVLGETGFTDVAVESQGLFYSVLADYYKQWANNLRIVRPFGKVTRWLMAHLFVLRFQQWAFRREQKEKIRSDAFIQSFTTGFGIVAKKK